MRDLHHLLLRWFGIARKGFCTMDPDVGAWVQACNGRDVHRGEHANAVMSLAKAVKLLLHHNEEVQRLLTAAHTAGADSQLHRLVYIALCALVKEATT